jgi:hypothetical protein
MVAPLGPESGLVQPLVSISASRAGYHGDPGGCADRTEPLGDGEAVGGRAAGADEGDADAGEEIESAAGEEHGGRS